MSHLNRTRQTDNYHRRLAHDHRARQGSGYAAVLALVAGMSLSQFACNGDEAQRPFWSDWEVVEKGLGHELRRGPSGEWTLVMVDALGDSISGTATERFPGPVPLRVQEFELEEDQMPKPVDDSESARRQQEFRFVTEVTIFDADDQPFCLVRIFDGLARLIGEHRKAGICQRTRPNLDSGEKVISVEREGGTHWILVDYISGDLLAESQFAIRDSGALLKSVEVFGGKVIVILTFRGSSEIRVRVYTPAGRLEHVFTIPGIYVGGVDNKQRIKAITTQFGDTTFNDLVNVITFDEVPVAATGTARNGIRGRHEKLQYHNVSGQDRFVEVVYDAVNEETTIRVIDGDGNLIALQPLAGKFNSAQTMGPNGERKVFVLERPPYAEQVLFTDVTVIDLVTGNTKGQGSFAGKVTALRENSDEARAEVDTRAPAGDVVTNSVPLN